MRKKLNDGVYIGQVVDANDDTFSGRCRINVYGVTDELEPEFLPWFVPSFDSIVGSGGGGKLSVPREHSIVLVKFMEDDVMTGTYTSMFNASQDVSDLIKDDYVNAQVIVCDRESELYIYRLSKEGLVTSYKGSVITISPTSTISFVHSNNETSMQMDESGIKMTSNSNISISGKGVMDLTAAQVNINSETIMLGANNELSPSYTIKGDLLMPLLETMASIIDQKLPVTPLTLSSVIQTVKKSLINPNIVTL